MTLPDFTASRGGQINSSGDETALFLKKFSGEVLATFETQTKFNDLHTVRTIADGR